MSYPISSGSDRTTRNPIFFKLGEDERNHCAWGASLSSGFDRITPKSVIFEQKLGENERNRRRLRYRERPVDFEYEGEKLMIRRVGM